jgi:hypothetical protein
MITGLAFALFAAVLLGCTDVVVVSLFLWIRHWKGQRKAVFAALADRLGFRYVHPATHALREGLRPGRRHTRGLQSIPRTRSIGAAMARPHREARRRNGPASR